MDDATHIKALFESVRKEAALWIRDEACVGLGRPLAACMTTCVQIHVPAAICTAIELGIFKLLGANAEMTATQLSEETHADTDLLIRMLRMLVASGYLNELGEYKYSLTPRGMPYGNEAQADYALLCLEEFAPPSAAYPSYLQSIKYTQPNSTTGSAFAFFHKKPGYGYFNYLNDYPEKQAHFASGMPVTLNSAAENSDSVRHSYEKELADIASGELAIVDVGGGHGHYLQAIVNRNPEVKGRFVKRDLKACLDSVSWPTPRMELMAYDFFTPQPLKGARVYQLRRVLHDWPDDMALKILRITAEAMDPARSRLQIVERIIPSMGATLNDAVSDMTMFVVAGMERTEAQWRALLKSAGLEIEIIQQGAAVESLIQCIRIV